MNSATNDPRIERTRRVVLDSTADLIGEVGFGRTTIEAIAERSGVARSTIYRHWPQREDLLLEAVTKRMTQPGVSGGSGDLKTDLLELMGMIVGLMTADDTRLVAANFITEAWRDEELARVHHRFVNGRRQMALAVLTAAVERGELAASTDLVAFANDLAAPIFFRTLVLHEQISNEWLEQHIDRWIGIYQDGA